MILEDMARRLKIDRVVLDQRKFNLEKERKFLVKQKEVMVLDINGVSESDDRCNKIYKKYLAELKAEKDERIEDLASL